jgi:methylglutaconyl-CoA hydratase
MSEPTVRLEVDPRGVATLTLNRPQVNNAYNGEMIGALLEHGARAAADPAVRMVVLRGAGRHFQAGADLNWIREIADLDEDANLAVSRRTAQAVRSLNELPKPTLALVHGACYGGGVGIVSACDVVIAEETASFAITEARWGLVASIIIPQLNGALGVRNVRRYALSCERFDARRAASMGLVHECCAPGGLEAAAAPVIDAFLLSAPDAIAETKRLALEDAGLRVGDEALETLVRGHSAKRRTVEAAEGLASFREKRPPAWYRKG